MQSKSFPGQYDKLNVDVFWSEGLFLWVWAYTWVFCLDAEDRTRSWVILSPELLPALTGLAQSVPGRAGPGGAAKHCPGDPAVPGTACPSPHSPAEQWNYMYRWNNGIQNEWKPKEILPVFSNAGAKSVFPYLCWLDAYTLTISFSNYLAWLFPKNFSIMVGDEHMWKQHLNCFHFMSWI